MFYNCYIYVCFDKYGFKTPVFLDKSQFNTPLWTTPPLPRQHPTPGVHYSPQQQQQHAYTDGIANMCCIN